MNIKEIAFRLNELSSGYKIGSLQQIRKVIKGLKATTGKDIFAYKTETNKSIFADERYAFHYGGRSEFQFNIGFGKKIALFRYGLAFSLKKGKSMKDVSIIFKRIDKFNSYIKLYPKIFSEMYYWYYDNGTYSDIMDVQAISDSLKKEGVFIFIGKYFEKTEAEVEYADLYNILSTFDELLELYLYVENNTKKFKLDKTKIVSDFLFQAGFNEDLPEETEGETKRRKYAIRLKHNTMKTNICKYLENVYGKGFVGDENKTPSGSRIDIVVNKNGENTFYEVKISNSIRYCIREAFAQLMEYSYWSDKTNATKLIIVSENTITDEAQLYLKKLRNEFKIPIWYQKYNDETKILEETLY
jgi:hypothetical protein